MAAGAEKIKYDSPGGPARRGPLFSALRLLPLRRTRQRTIAAASKATRSWPRGRLRLPRRSRPTALSLRSSAFDGRCACFPSDARANKLSPQPQRQQHQGRGGGCGCRGAHDQQHSHFAQVRSTGAALASPQTHAPTNHRRSLWYNQIGAEGAAALAEALKTNSTLTSLECVRRALRLLPLRRTRQHCIAAASLGTRSCLLYTSPSPRDATLSRMPSSA